MVTVSKRRWAAVRWVLLLSASVVVCAHVAGCNTVKGVGRDVEAMAQGGQDIIDGKH